VKLTLVAIFSRDVKIIFDHVVNPIIELVKQQVLRVQENREDVAVSQPPPCMQLGEASARRSVFHS
jgi:hypothetical protein